MMPKALLAAMVILCVGAVSVWGATTGAISGLITDAQTGEPVVGVTVMVVGTSLGASTDVDGRYMIINVPVGTYTLQISSVGYANVEVSNVSVSVDLTTYQSQTLSSQATDIGRTIQVIAERKLVIEDKTTSVNIVTRDELLAMPTRGFEQVVGIQNSVVRMNSNIDTRQRGFRPATSSAPEINLRGGRPSEVAYYVDGFSQQDPLSGLSTANISNNAIKEVSVTSGAFSAEYGNVASGIVNVTTNSGTDKFHGNLEAVTDNAAGQLGYDAFDQNWYSGDLSGPVLPGTDMAYFFVSGERRYLGDRQPSIRTKEVYTKYGLDSYLDEPWQKPANSLKGWSYQGKLDFNFTPSLKFGFSANGSKDWWQQYTHNYFNPDFPEQVWHSPLYLDQNIGINAKITHTLNAATFYNLSASYFKTRRQRGDGILFDNYKGYDRGYVNPEVDGYQLFQEGNVTWASDTSTTDDIEAGDPGDVVVNYAPSYFDDYFDQQSSYLGFKGDITRQLSTVNTLKAGFDFQRHTIRYFRDLVPTKNVNWVFNPEGVDYFGFDSLGNETNTTDFPNGVKHPINLGLYLQERLEYRGLIVSGGLRFDYFDYKSEQISNVENPSDPENVGDGEMTASDLESSKKYSRLSPRIGVSFPISDRSQMHINYGIFYQRPDLSRLYTNYLFLFARQKAGSYFPFPSPNLGPETTTQYEIGLTHQLGDYTAFDVTAYYKDVKDLTQIYTQSAEPKEYSYFANEDFGTIKGFDFSLTMRRIRNLAMSIKYSLSYANGTGSYAQSTYNIAWKNQGFTPKQTNPLDYDQRHSIIGMFDFRTVKGEGPKWGSTYPFENMGVNVLMQFASGTPYTPTDVYDAVSTGSVDQIPTGTINSAYMPWTYSVDMKVERTFKFKSVTLVPYIWVKNLLNIENVNSVFEGTGEANTTGYLNTLEAQGKATDATELAHFGTTSGEQYLNRYNLLQNNPTNWSQPRMIMAGLRMSF